MALKDDISSILVFMSFFKIKYSHFYFRKKFIQLNIMLSDYNLFVIGIFFKKKIIIRYLN